MAERFQERNWEQMNREKEFGEEYGRYQRLGWRPTHYSGYGAQLASEPFFPMEQYGSTQPYQPQFTTGIQQPFTGNIQPMAPGMQQPFMNQPFFGPQWTPVQQPIGLQQPIPVGIQQTYGYQQPGMPQQPFGIQQPVAFQQPLGPGLQQQIPQHIPQHFMQPPSPYAAIQQQPISPFQQPQQQGFPQLLQGQQFQQLGQLGPLGQLIAQRAVMGRFSGLGPKNYRRPDERIREDAMERLTTHPDIDATNIEITVKNGEISLKGSVEDRLQKRLVEDIVECVFGVIDVQNQLKVEQTQWNQYQHAGLGSERESELTGSTTGRSREK